MIVLAIDTAHTACSVSVYDAGAEKVLASISEPMRQGHAERLPSMVTEALGMAGIPLSKVDRLAACSGPGTFTGVRIGLAFIRGLALVLEAPAVGVTTFQGLAAGARATGASGDVWVIQDARRGEVYLQGFDATGAPFGEAHVLGIAAADKALAGAKGVAVGSGVSLLQLPDSLKAGDLAANPDVSHLARLAATADPAVAVPAPFYLREPDAKAQAPLVRHEAAAVSIRHVGVEHATMLAAIHAAGFDDPWHVEAMAELLATPGCIGLLAISGADSNGEPCGFVLARKAADEMEILTIAVVPPMRRRGVGKALLDHLSGIARCSEAASIFIEYAADNAAAAQLYSRQGFRSTGRRKNYYRRSGGSACDAVTARLDL